MKRFGYYLLHFLQLIIVTFVILWGILLAIIKLWGGAFNNYSTDIAKYLNNKITMPINFKRVTLTLWRGEPVLEFEDFRCGDKKKLVCKRLQVGIDLMGTILHHKFQLKLLNISGVSLSLNLNSNGTLQLPVNFSEISKISTPNQNNKERQFWWERGDVNLHDCEINLQLPGKRSISGKKLAIHLSGAIGHLEASVYGVITLSSQKQEPISTTINSKLKLFGSITDLSMAKLIGKIELSGGTFDLTSWLSDQIYASSEDTDAEIPFVPQGEIDLQCSDLQLKLPWFRYFFEPKRINTRIKWHKREASETVMLNFEYYDRWLNFIGHGKCQLRGDESPQVDCQANYSLSNVRYIKRYYPATLMHPKALDWLDKAFPQSKVLRGKMALRGKLADFPFDRCNSGEFKVITALNEVTLNYDNDWPQINKIMGDLVFSGRAMDIYVKSGTILGSHIQSVHALIDDLSKPQLYIDGHLIALSTQGVKFIERSPLNATVGKFLMPLTLKGKIKLDLRFIMPLDESFVDDVTKVTGSVNFIDNELLIKGLNLTAQKINGTLEFSEDQVRAHKLKGKCYGRDLIIKIDPVNNTTFAGTEVTILGKLLPALLKHFKVPNSYVGALKGEADYSLVITIPYADELSTMLKLTSDLRGFSSNLPELLAKKAPDRKKLLVALEFPDLATPKLKLSLGTEIKIDASLQQDIERNIYQLKSGIISFNRPITEVKSPDNLLIQGNLPKLNLALWLKLLNSGHDSHNGLINHKNLILDLTCGEFVAFNHLLTDVVLRGSYQDQRLSLKVKIKDSSGEINYDAKKAHVKANFTELSLTPLNNLETQTIDFRRTLPFTLEFSANNLVYGKYRFDNLAVKLLSPRKNTWQFSQIKIVMPYFILTGEGSSQIKNLSIDSKFRRILEVNNLGEWLSAKKYSQLLRKTSGKFTIDINWPGFITEFTLSNLNGSLKAELYNGSVINLDKSTEQKLGISKLLSILSISSLSKLLTMNFQDLHQGFTFDFAKGEGKIYDGKLKLSDFLIDSTAAKIDFSGDIDLIRGDYALRMKVVPNITSSLPIAATILGGPIGGAIGFLADHLVKVIVKSANFYEYELQGNWNHKS